VCRREGKTCVIIKTGGGIFILNEKKKCCVIIKAEEGELVS
jgi:glucose uptake protein GlcU